MKRRYKRGFARLTYAERIRTDDKEDSMSEAAVEIRDLTKVIGDKTIVDSLTFDIPKGEVFGLLGPNGAGKTTTIRMMVGLISATRGSVRIDGIDVTKDFKGAMEHIGVIVENPEFYNFLTGYQNLWHFARMSKGIPHARIETVLRQMGLAERLHDKVKTYSLGMRQRLGLAQALLRNPDVVILDEPTNGLDPAGIRELRDYLRALAAKDDVAVIVSSHLLSEMELMCDRVGIIQSGRLVDVRPIRVSFEDSEAQPVSIEVGEEDRAVEIVGYAYPDLTVKQAGGRIELQLKREEIPDLIHVLDTHGIRIYGVRAVNKTLEETFLEITGDRADA